MAPFHSQFFTNLLLQAKYAPYKQRFKQLDACESLLQIIQKGKQYPIEFVCYHLTGYRPKNELETQELIDYEHLLKDLPAFCEKLSRTMRISSDSVKGKFYTNASLAKHFRVSEKTVTRWRKMGLTGRYLVYPDGRLRLAYSEPAVDFFIRSNKKRVQKSASFSQISPAERRDIENRLTKWARRCPDHRSDAIRRTAAKFCRSHEAIRSILTQMESTQSSQKFYKYGHGISDSEGEAIFAAYQNGVAVDELVIQFKHSRATIYRIINLIKSRQLIQREIQYINSPEFQTLCAADILTPPEGLFTSSSPTVNAVQDNESLKLDTLGYYIRDIYHTNLLTAQQEFFLFRKFNYLKYLADQERISLDPSQPSGRSLNRIRLYLQQAREVQNQLVSSNLRLVIHVARKHVHVEPNIIEYISEGNLTLIRSIEKFDFTRGNKFSTYATWALIKRYATLKTAMARTPVSLSTHEAIEVSDNLRIPANQVAILESTRKNLNQILRDHLEEREQFILREHFGLAEPVEDSAVRTPRSLTQIAKLIGLSKERVRQIEIYALRKLRKHLSVDQFDLLTQV